MLRYGRKKRPIAHPPIVERNDEGTRGERASVFPEDGFDRPGQRDDAVSPAEKTERLVGQVRAKLMEDEDRDLSLLDSGT
jgi:hypothetical protein